MIKEQMQIKEQERQMARRKSQQELENVRAQERQRKAKISRVLEEKVNELKMSQVPPKLIKDVERRIKQVAESK